MSSKMNVADGISLKYLKEELFQNIWKDENDTSLVNLHQKLTESKLIDNIPKAEFGKADIVVITSPLITLECFVKLLEDNAATGSHSLSKHSKIVFIWVDFIGSSLYSKYSFEAGDAREISQAGVDELSAWKERIDEMEQFKTVQSVMILLESWDSLNFFWNLPSFILYTNQLCNISRADSNDVIAKKRTIDLIFTPTSRKQLLEALVTDDGEAVLFQMFDPLYILLGGSDTKTKSTGNSDTQLGGKSVREFIEEMGVPLNKITSLVLENIRSQLIKMLLLEMDSLSSVTAITPANSPMPNRRRAPESPQSSPSKHDHNFEGIEDETEREEKRKLKIRYTRAVGQLYEIGFDYDGAEIYYRNYLTLTLARLMDALQREAKAKESQELPEQSANNNNSPTSGKYQIKIPKKSSDYLEREKEYFLVLQLLSIFYYKIGQDDKAELLYEESLNEAVRKLGKTHSHTLKAMYNLSLFNVQLNRYEKVANIIDECYELRRSFFGEKDPDTLQAMHLLGEVLIKTEKYHEAEAMLRNCLERRREVLDDKENTIEIAATMISLVNIYIHLERQVEAELYLGLLETRLLKELGEISVFLNRLSANTTETSESNAMATAVASRRALSSKERDALSFYQSLAPLYCLIGFTHFSKAERIYLDCLAAKKQSFGDHHPETLRTLFEFACFYSSHSQYDNAELLHLECLEKRRRMLGECHLDTFTSMHQLSLVYSSHNNQLELAEAYLVGVIERRRTALGLSHPDTLAAMADLASLYQKQPDREQDVEKLLKEAYERRKERYGDMDITTVNYMNNLAAFYYENNSFHKAAPLYHEKYLLKKRVLGAKHPDTLIAEKNHQIIQAKVQSQEGCVIS